MSAGRSPVVLVAADPHGRIPLLLKLAWKYQRDFSRSVGEILVCGDLGIFPDDWRLDAATRKFAKRFPEEMGFRVFESLFKCKREQPTPRLTRHLRQASRVVAAVGAELAAPVYFVGGNHEDYHYLARCQRAACWADVVPVERSERLRWIAQCARVELDTCLGILRVVALSGIDAAGAHRNPDKLNTGATRHDEDVLTMLLAGDGQPVDLLLTHDGAADVGQPGWGSPAISEAVRELEPTYHFWGHEHVARAVVRYSEIEDGAFEGLRTTGALINKLDLAPGQLEPRSLGVLSRSDDGDLRFEFAEPAWLAQTNARNWPHT